MVAVNAEAFKVEHAEGFHHRLSTGDFVKVVIGDFGHGAAITEIGIELVELGGFRIVAPV